MSAMEHVAVVPAAAMPPASTAPLLVGRYRLHRRVAPGDLGEVWRATDVVLARTVAIQVMRPESAGDPGALARFRDKARHAGSVAHPGLIRTYDYDETSSFCPAFLVMEFVDGPSLDEILARGPLEPLRVLDIVAQVASALDAAEQAGFTHYDITLENVLLNRDGHVKLTDFAGTGPAGGRGAPGTTDSHLYELGVVAYQCLVGNTPFSGNVLPRLPMAIPAGIATLISDITAKDPGGRPASAAGIARRASSLRDRMTASEQASGEYPAAVRPLPRAAGPAPQVPARPWHVNGHERHGRYVMLTAVAAAAIFAAFMVARVTAPGLHPPAVAAVHAGAALVEVNGATLRDQPVDAVRSQLLRAGLAVAVRWNPDSQVPAGRVVSVSPSGPVPSGTLIVVVGALRPAKAGTPVSPTLSSSNSGHPGSHRNRPAPSASASATSSPTASGAPPPTASPPGSPTTPTPTATPTASPAPSSGATPTPSSTATALLGEGMPDSAPGRLAPRHWR
ncbi:MAG: serine/threonine protein kinase [Actinomycetia bacterium]|nr:serine/threonine protein kinase [Actinomycetes bacterium]